MKKKKIPWSACLSTQLKDRDASERDWALEPDGPGFKSPLGHLPPVRLRVNHLAPRSPGISFLKEYRNNRLFGVSVIMYVDCLVSA